MGGATSGPARRFSENRARLETIDLMFRSRLFRHAIAVALLAAGCATVDVPDLEPVGRERVMLDDVEYSPQRGDDDCAVACVTTVLRHLGSDLAFEEIDEGLKRVEGGGVIPVEILFFARMHGYRVTLLDSGLNDLRQRLTAGRPLILLLHYMPRANRRLAGLPGHYVVAVGFDDATREVIVHSDTSSFQRKSYRSLQRRWSESDFLAIQIDR